MHKVEIRTGVWVAYEDHWFGNPWTLPGTVVMVHGNSESSLAWRPWVPHLAGKYRVIRLDMPGFGASMELFDYAWTARELSLHKRPRTIPEAVRGTPSRCLKISSLLSPHTFSSCCAHFGHCLNIF